MPGSLRLAIIGGGLAGCTLANGLASDPNIAFDVFESKSTFGERGAGVGLGVNVQEALRLMGLDVDHLLRDAGAVRQQSMTALIGQGKHKGQVMFELPGGNMTVARDLLLAELIKSLPSERLHANKKLVTIQENNDSSLAPLTVHFADGSTFDADLVVGCDGIHSQTRRIVLGENHPATNPVFGGYWDARGVISTAQAVEQFGTELFDPAQPRVFAVVGDGVFMMFAPMTEGERYTAIVSGAAGPGYDTTAWKMPIERDFLERSYADWDEKLREGVISCLLSRDVGPGVMFSQWESAKAPTYVRGRIAMIGDSAHGTTPWMGMGAGMAIEDCSVMANLLKAASSRDNADLALVAFDKARRGRPEYVVEHSQKAGKGAHWTTWSHARSRARC